MSEIFHSEQVVISLDSWIVQDGNYADFAMGDQCQFSVEFFDLGLARTAARVRAFERGSSDTYKAVAQVVWASDEAWVIDFGLKVFRNSRPPEGIRVGDWVEGTLGLGVDPFFYKENLYQLHGIPSLTYTWNICGIQREETPWLIERNGQGAEIHTRDKANESWASVEKTDAWEDDGGRANYLLHCKLVVNAELNR